MAKMTIRLLALFLVIGSIGMAHAAEDLGMLNDALRGATDDTERAGLHKKIGDYHVSKGDYRNAADAYAHALSTAGKTFPVEERIQIAIYMSWGGKIPEAIGELRSILAEDPSRRAARLHLARSLSWIGRIDEALLEAEKLLADSPEGSDALLVKANALRWKGDCRSAVPLYTSLLANKEDFDARLGLAYCRLSAGMIREAKEDLKLLAPKYANQAKEKEDLSAAIGQARRPDLDLKTSYYSDSDDNRLKRYSAFAGFWASSWKVTFAFRHVDARDPSRENRAEEFTLGAFSRLSGSIGLGGGVGLTRTANDNAADFVTGHFRAEAPFLKGTISAGASREVFAETARLIENRIRFRNLTAAVAQQLARRLSLHGSYSHRDFSDDNRSDDAQLAVRHSFDTANPRFGAGYRFRYLNFERESGSGYFDPSDFVSHQLFLSFHYEKQRFYANLEPHAGHQSFRRDGRKSRNGFGGGSGLIGLRVTPKISVEVNGEGGNSAGGTATGFSYYLVGLRLRTVF